MWKCISQFFKELFKDDVGEYNPEAKKMSLGWKIYWIVGSILSIIIPLCFLYLEVGRIDWNIIKLVWNEAGGILRVGYFIVGILSNFLFLALGYLTTYRINGSEQLLRDKKVCRIMCIFGFLLSIACYIFANIMY